MLWLIVAKEKNRKKLFFEGLPFSIWAGVAFVIPSVLTVFLGQEFPSILGAFIALAIVLLTTKLKIFTPKSNMGSHLAKPPEKRIPAIKAITPYLLLIAALISGKFILSSATITLPTVIKHSINLFNPGFAFLLVAIPLELLINKKNNHITSIGKASFMRAMGPFLVILFMSGVVQIMVNSFQNPLGFPSMIEVLASNFKNNLIAFWAPLIGAFGSFITGSVTISNLMFGNIVSLAAIELNKNVSIILALTLVGAAAGNMIALADIISAESVVGLKNKERTVIKGVIVPCLFYLTMTGIVGLLIFHFIS